jgi:predicted nucleic acid-binding protein
VQNPGPHGFGRAISLGLDAMYGDAAVASAAQVIVTFNKRDLAAAEDFGIALMTPKEFLLNLPL